MLSGALILFTILLEGDERRQTSKINKGAAVYIVYYLNGPYTKKLESPYKDPSSTFGSERVKLLKLSSHHYNSKKNGPLLLFETIFRYLKCFPSSI